MTKYRYKATISMLDDEHWLLSDNLADEEVILHSLEEALKAIRKRNEP